jgi:hypothetical protein
MRGLAFPRRSVYVQQTIVFSMCSEALLLPKIGKDISIPPGADNKKWPPPE